MPAVELVNRLTSQTNARKLKTGVDVPRRVVYGGYPRVGTVAGVLGLDVRTFFLFFIIIFATHSLASSFSPRLLYLSHVRVAVYVRVTDR